jgi:hypothetical protein
MFFLRGLFLWLLVKWRHSKESPVLWASLGVAMLGTFDKLNFLWCVYAAVFALVVCNRRDLSARFAAKSRQSLALLVIGAVFLGVASVEAIRLTSDFSLQPWSWKERLQQFKAQAVIAAGGTGIVLATSTDGRSSPVPTVSHDLAVGMELAWAVLAATCLASMRVRGKAAFDADFVFIALFTVALVVCVFATPTASGPHHTAIISGLPQLLLARFLLGGPKPSKVSKAAIAVAAGALIGTNVTIDRYLAQSYRNRSWEPAIIGPAEYLELRPGLQVTCVDWGVCTQLAGLTNGKTKTRDAWPAFRSLDGAIADLSTTSLASRAFLVRAPGAEAFPETRANLFAAANKLGLPLRRVGMWKADDGQPVTELYLATADQS